MCSENVSRVVTTLLAPGCFGLVYASGLRPCAYFVAVGLWMGLAALQTASPRLVSAYSGEPEGQVHNDSSGSHRGRQQGANATLTDRQLQPL